jgi:hypothetical protein
MKSSVFVISLLAVTILPAAALSDGFPIADGKYCDQSQSNNSTDSEEIGDGSITIAYPSVSFSEYSFCKVKSYKKVDDDYKIVLTCTAEDDQFDTKALWSIKSENRFELDEIEYEYCGSSEGRSADTPATLASESTNTRGNPEYTFETYPIDEIYKGATRLPEFSGRDQEFKDYRTRIREGMKEGPNLAGEFSVIQIGCGTGCSLAYVASNKTGQVFDFPRGGDDNLEMQLLSQLNSRLIVVQWSDRESNSCTMEFMKWEQSSAISLTKTRIGDREACFNDIKDNFRN